MTRVCVLYGGRSGEHDVSLCSAASVVGALDPARYEIVAVGISREGKWHVQDRPEIIDDRDFGRKMALRETGTWLAGIHGLGGRFHLYEIETGRHVESDVVFPVLHGTYGEDGTLQGLLELAMVPYVGADVLGSSIGMDKDVSKRLLREAGIPVVPWITVGKAAWEKDPSGIESEALKELGLPLFIKPVCAGSSVGVGKVRTAGDFRTAMNNAMAYDTRVLIEKGLDCREIECSVLGNLEPAASRPGEVIPRHEFYSYEAKYIDPDGASLVIPAKINDALSERICADAIRGYTALCCSGMARVDFFLEKNTDKYYLNEINTLPGFTSISMYPKLWEATGLSYPRLIDRLIDLAFERHRLKCSIQTSFSCGS